MWDEKEGRMVPMKGKEHMMDSGFIDRLGEEPRAPKVKIRNLTEAMREIRRLRSEVEAAKINEQAIRNKYNDECSRYHQEKNLGQWHRLQIAELKTAINALTKAVGA